MKIRIGTRSSALALRQTELIINKIKSIYPDTVCEIVKIQTMGDKRTDIALEGIGGKGLFCTAIEDKLLSEEIDMAVHSAKDMPSVTDRRFAISVITKREDARDVLITNKGYDKSKTLYEGAVIGTSSPRREKLIKRLYPDCEIKLLRGNINTRLSKLKNNEYDAIVLAAAGINRLYEDKDAVLSDFDLMPFDVRDVIPSAGQGIIACETLPHGRVYEMLKKMELSDVKWELEKEKRVTQALGADCKDAVGAHVYHEAGRTRLVSFFGDSKIYDKEIRGKDSGFVYIAGAGPDDISYMSLYTYNLVKSADVILYDSLTDKSISEHTKAGCEMISVGKRAGRHSMKQKDICSLMIKKASEGKTVLRLKGGDPFVFGRAMEECEALKGAGIDYEIVPGISSAIAIPELAGIPITFREDDKKKSSRGFLTLTAHTKDDDDISVNEIAGFDGTIIFLMGILKIDKIVSALISAGRDKDTPVAVICSTDTNKRHIRKGRLKSIVKECGDDPLIVPPGIIVVGEAADYDLRCKNGDVRVLVTGTRQFCQRQYEHAMAKGISIDMCAHLVIEPMGDIPVSDIVSDESDMGKVLAFFGKNSADIFFDSLRDNGLDIRVLSGVYIAAIGDVTADYLWEAYHIRSDIVPDEYTSGALAHSVADFVKKRLSDHKDVRVFAIRAAKGSDAFKNILSREKIFCREIKVYDTMTDDSEVKKALACKYDMITFGSVGGVRGFFDTGADIKGAIAVAIGPAVADALSAYTDNIVVTDKADAAGIMDKVADLSLESEYIKNLRSIAGV